MPLYSNESYVLADRLLLKALIRRPEEAVSTLVSYFPFYSRA